MDCSTGIFWLGFLGGGLLGLVFGLEFLGSIFWAWVIGIGFLGLNFWARPCGFGFVRALFLGMWSGALPWASVSLDLGLVSTWLRLGLWLGLKFRLGWG